MDHDADDTFIDTLPSTVRVPNDHVGYLLALDAGAFGVCCHACHAAANLHPVSQPIKLLRVNVEPYKQACHGCGETIVQGRTPAWPELFPNPVK